MDDVNLQEPQLRDYFAILIRRRKLVVLPIVIAVLAVAYFSLKMYPVYQATATIQVENERGMGISFAQSFFPDYGYLDEKWMNTQVRIIQSRAVAEGVVKKLGLNLRTEPEEPVYQILFREFLPLNWLFNHWGFKVHITPIAVSEEAPIGDYYGNFSDSEHFAVYRKGKEEIGRGQVGVPFFGPHFSFKVNGKGAVGKKFKFTILPEGSVVAAVRGSLIVHPIKDSNLMRVGANWGHPETARDIANAAVAEYKEAVISRRQEEASRVLTFVEGQLQKTEKDLSTAEQSLQKFKAEKAAILDARMKGILDQISSSEKEYRATENLRKQAEILLSALQKRGKFSEKVALFSLGEELNNDSLRDLSKRFNDLNAQRSALIVMLKEQHPKIQAIDHEIESIKASIISEVRALIISLRGKETTYQAALNKLEEKVQRLPSTEKELFGLERVVKVGQGLNSLLLQKKAELNVNKGGILGNVRVNVIDPSVSPMDYSEPLIGRRILWALLIGGLLGISLAFLVEHFDTTVKTPEQLQRLTNVPYLGTVYHSLMETEEPTQKLEIMASPNSHIAEAFRTIKTNFLYYSTQGDEKKVFLITSSGPSEGKTFITANLAVTLAQSGKRVLIAETDLRNPALHRIMGRPKTPGLTNALANSHVEFSRLPIQGTFQENLHFIGSGDKPSRPSELLSSEKMERFFSLVRGHFDFVLFDSPPAFLTSDPLVLAQQVDGVIFVARSGEVRKEIFVETLSNFMKYESKMFGMIFNDMYREGGSYYYYKYSYYYGEDGSGKRKRKTKMRKRVYPYGSRTAISSAKINRTTS